MGSMEPWEASMERAHEAWKRRWGEDRAPRYSYTVKLECDLQGYGDAVEVLCSAHVENARASFDPSETPQCVLEFDCTYGAWEGLRKSLESVPASGRWYHQQEKESAETCS